MDLFPIDTLGFLQSKAQVPRLQLHLQKTGGQSPLAAKPSELDSVTH